MSKKTIEVEFEMGDTFYWLNVKYEPKMVKTVVETIYVRDKKVVYNGLHDIPVYSTPEKAIKSHVDKVRRQLKKQAEMLK